ncbi:hypothetical protein [Xylella fastidiosa]|nr:hypothetical protein [Xylella fastidiosa]MDC7971233.1 hypothetical protein [Xylella fastidiosa subsp. multiplex]MDD0928484.1 hypothetical protein [Xylella fastidiosa subsp. multiplex]MDD0935009.1 hypothetical protein [Xylella fastidiosa subsp. multiplex]WDF06488.1 hypothetical protein PT012_08470 [Xylella fastidiosa subsp. multiplex]WDN66097.1 hypothetical protein XYFPCFBP8416_008160 [Xylella fastidiosa subsp. multiplex]
MREQGIPLVTTMIRSPEGRRMARYTFGDPVDIQAGRIGGRKAFPKRLKQQLLARDGSIDMFTGQHVPETALTIDHHIPYEVAGDIGDDFDPAEFMLLDGSSQRSKSWSCENWQTAKDPDVCRTCYWAYPEDYSHMVLLQLRRVDVSWSGDDVNDHDTLRHHAQREGVSVQELVKRAVKELLQRLRAT